jgi:hypothetical protein
MSLFNVPQFIDIEDKIVGPLTAKQLGWLALDGVLLLFCWSFLDTSAFIVVAIILSIIFGALAFYRPHSQPLIMFILSAIYFFTKPKIYMWKRLPNQISSVKASANKKTVPAISRKELSSQKIEEISKLLEINKR